MKIQLPSLKGILMICCVLTLGGITAQDVTFVPEYMELSITDAEANQSKKHGFEMTNNTSQTLEWYWNLGVPADVPAEWEIQICDLNLCYDWGGFASSDFLPNEHPAGMTTDPSLQYINVAPNGQAGTAVVEFCIYGDAARTEEIFCTTIMTSTNELGEIISHDLYPNPAINGFYISNDELVESLTITTVTGEKLMSQAHKSGAWVDASALPDGNYVVTTFNRNNVTTGVQRFVKSSGN